MEILKGGQTEIKKNQVGQGRKPQAADCENGLTYIVICLVKVLPR